MTYLSTDIILSTAKAANKLDRFIPELYPYERDDREIWMPPALKSWLYESDSRQTLDFKAKVRAHLKKFIINAKEQPIDNEWYMKNLSNSVSQDVFEVRYQLTRRHKDNTRIFGGFAKKDCLVVFHQKLRRNISDWDQMIEKTLDMWNATIPEIYMVRARPFSNCVTGSFVDVH